MAEFAVERTYNIPYLQSNLSTERERRFDTELVQITTYNETV